MPFFFDENAPQPSGWHGLAQRPQSDWADEMFRALQENELRLLCLDFDRTILRVLLRTAAGAAELVGAVDGYDDESATYSVILNDGRVRYYVLEEELREVR